VSPFTPRPAASRQDSGDAVTKAPQCSAPPTFRGSTAWIAYSGFNALTPTTPGHVFEVTWDPNTSTSQWTSLDDDLDDLPVNHLVRDANTGDLYAATDFGVLVHLR
jgi:hypothetical protein